MVLADMVSERVERPASIARGIIDLGTNLAERLALPSHFTRGEMPDLVARHARGIEVGALMADWTAQSRKSKSINSTLDRRLVEPNSCRPDADGRPRDGSSDSADSSAPCPVL